MSELSDKIKQLHSEGWSYRQIEKELGCSKGTISYHVGKDQKEKYKVRRKAYMKDPMVILNIKIHGATDHPKSLARKTSDKISDFHEDTKTGKKDSRNFTVEELRNKAGNQPRCYLTGDPIDLSDPSSYELDHIVPRSKNGTNTLDNLGFTTPEANRAKNKMELEDFIELCVRVAKHHNRI